MKLLFFGSSSRLYNTYAAVTKSTKLPISPIINNLTTLRITQQQLQHFPKYLILLQTRKMSSDNDWKSKSNIYEFSAKDIDGNEVSMEKYKDHPLLVVNVATNCGLAKSNYKQLNELYDKFENDGLRIAAFPCNQFAGQEPGCDVDIKEFILKNGVRFDMYSKIDVNGDSAHPIYKWLKNKQGGFLGFDAIKWNFTKFLIDKEGIPVKRYAPTVEPKNIEPDITSLL